MKTILLVALITMAVSMSAMAQIEVTRIPGAAVIGTVKSGGYVLAELSQRIDGADTTNFLVFSNLQYRTINDYQTVSFKGDPGPLRFAVLSVLETGGKLSVTIGTTQAVLMKSGSSAVITTPTGYFMLTKNQVNRLFGG